MPSRPVATLAIMAVLLGALGGNAAAGEDRGVFGVRLEPHPDQAGLGLRGQVAIVADAQPGQVIERELTVANATGTPLELFVTPGAAMIEDNQFVPLDDVRDGIAVWTKVSTPPVLLEPDGTERVKVRIEVPKDVARGERYGAIWVAATAESDITRVNRVGVRVYLGVHGGADPLATDFAIEGLTAAVDENGQRTVRATVRNVGDRSLSVTGQVTLSDGPGGTSAGPMVIEGPVTIGVGSEAEVQATFSPDLPTGPWLARVELESGHVMRAVEGTLRFPLVAGDESPPVPVTPVPFHQDRSVVAPLASGLFGLVAILLVLLWRRRNDERDAGGASSVEAHESEREPVTCRVE